MNYIPETKPVKQLRLSEKVYLSSDILGMIDSTVVKLSVSANGTYSSEKSITPLSVVVASKDAYMNVSQTDNFLSDALYLVESDNLDACGNKIINVAKPTYFSDAANKQFVDDTISFNSATVASPMCFAPSKYVQGTQFDNCNSIVLTEFILSEAFGEIVGSDAMDQDGNVYLTMLKIRTRDVFNAQSNTVKAEILENPGESTDISEFIPVPYGISLNYVKCEPSRMMTFYFENAKLDVNKRYAIKFTDSNGNLKDVHLSLIADSKLKTKLANNTVISYIAILTMVGLAKAGGNAIKRLVMPDLSTNDLYEMFIQDGKLVRQKI